jgi:S1-C subfamily serine protease
LNSAGQVIGVNVAVAGGAENIGFAIPINIIKDSLSNFQETGSFDRPLLGVQYRMLSSRAALMNEVPQGAYIINVIENSSAADAGLQAEDIITKFDGQDLNDESSSLVSLINKKKINNVEVETGGMGKRNATSVKAGQTSQQTNE